MVRQMNRTVEYSNIPFGPYVMRTKIDEDIRIRLLKDGKKDRGYCRRQVKRTL